MAYVGTPVAKVSEGEEIVWDSKQNEGKELYELNFINGDECVIEVNGVEIYLEQFQDFHTSFRNDRIQTLKIKNQVPGVRYHWNGTAL